jgi:RNA-directed DNA polymerase
MSKARLTPMKEWNSIPWQKLERKVFKLQKRIFQASRREDVKTVHHLQKMLMKSWSAKCLAVRQVTQDNSGQKTAGIDGIKSLNPKQRLKLVDSLKISGKAQPVRRVWIPKPNSSQQRGLGIPTIYDRALQALVKLALEPEWEARFEQHSYGFRPGRSCHDAIEAIFKAICRQAKYVLDADICKCFDQINHNALLDKLNTFPTLYRQIRAWLKAGIMDGKMLFPTSEGIPQGGIASPILANIALHGLEQQVNQVSPKARLIRYCDDFVVLHEDLQVIHQCQQRISRWLHEMGLSLKPSKTHISHTLNPYQGRVGFDFLGFTVRQFSVGKHQCGKTGCKE